MKFNKKWLAAAAVLAVIALPIVIGKSKGEKGLEVEIVKAGLHEIRPTILASGVLAYRTEVNLTSELVAKVRSIEVEEGDIVEAGQLLMRLDPETYRNAIEREEASRRQSEISIQRQRVTLQLKTTQFERSKKMLAAKMIDQNKFDEDKNQFELAKVELMSSEEALRRANAVLSEAREQMGKTDIRAPISGKIVSLPIKVGETAIPSTSSLAGAQLMKIADTAAIQAELKVDEADIAKIAIGQKTDVFAAAYPETALLGTVEKIALAPSIEGQGRAYKVTVSMKVKPELLLRSGMSARANIFLSDGSKKLAVPVEAVNTETDEEDVSKITQFVWLEKEGKAKKAVVTVGDSDDSWQAISKGVKEGDNLITGPAKAIRQLRENDPVKQKPKDIENKSDKDEDTE
ncbi:MAG: efflux RND transporter periplasmic adaptor subunit [Arenimonas sp.]